MPPECIGLQLQNELDAQRELEHGHYTELLKGVQELVRHPPCVASRVQTDDATLPWPIGSSILAPQLGEHSFCLFVQQKEDARLDREIHSSNQRLQVLDLRPGPYGAACPLGYKVVQR